MSEQLVKKVRNKFTKSTILPLWLASWAGLICFSIVMWIDIGTTVDGLNQSGMQMFSSNEAWLVAIVILIAQVLSGYTFFGLIDFNAGSKPWKLTLASFVVWFLFFFIDSGTDVLFRMGGTDNIITIVSSVTFTIVIYTIGSEVGWSFCLALLQEIHGDGYEAFLKFADEITIMLSGFFGLVLGILTIPLGWIATKIKIIFGGETSHTIPYQKTTTRTKTTPKKKTAYDPSKANKHNSTNHHSKNPRRLPP